MIQIENEYGSFGEEKEYLRAIRDLMIKRGVTVPFSLQMDRGGLLYEQEA